MQANLGIRILLSGLFFVVTSAQATWLHMCPTSVPSEEQATPPASAIQVTSATSVTLPDGTQRRLIVADSPPAVQCRSIELPVPSEMLEAVHPVSASLAASLNERAILSGDESHGRFQIGSVSGDAEKVAAASAEMPWRENLLTAMTAQAFGSEERVKVQLVDGRLRLQCEAGVKPAGVILKAPWYMSRANFQLQVSAKGRGRFDLLAADTAHTAKESAAPVGILDMRNMTNASFVSDHVLTQTGFDRATWQSFSIACPAEKSELVVEALKLVPHMQKIAGRSTWVWNPQLWQQQADTVFSDARKYGIRVLFISVPVGAGKVNDSVALASFIRDASARGLQVWAVDGDPRMVLPTEQAATIARVHAYAAYNASVDILSRLHGVQFDIEPYLLPGYEIAKEDLDGRYVQLVRALHQEANGLAIEMVVPFWWNTKPQLLAQIAPFIAGLAVMDYRTDAKEIIRFATPFLDWGAAQNKTVRIALEAGPVDAETVRRYARSASGELWLVTLEKTPLLVLFRKAYGNAAGPVFRQVGSSVLDGSATSFHKRKDRLLGMLPSLESDLSAWDAFNGMALHELK